MTNYTTRTYEVIVIGAGPYGLSAAAHLKNAGVSIRVFGDAMSFWRDNMPKGMRLRSPWIATNISDPAGHFSLDAYADRHELTAQDRLPIEDFVAYGKWFQRFAVSELDTRHVVSIDESSKGFQVRLADGELFYADRVVVATGLANQDFWPAPFKGLPRSLVSHTANHATLETFRNRHVAVVGRGQSACESAVLLNKAGAKVDLICRGDIHWIGSEVPSNEAPKNLYWRLRKRFSAPSAVGPFPFDWLNELPGILHGLPGVARRFVNRRSLRAGATALLKEHMTGVQAHSGRTIMSAREEGNRIVLSLENSSLAFDHVLLATGYKIELERLSFLRPELIQKIRCDDGAPVLVSGFESSVPGLHFIGASAVKSYGPLVRFIAGSRYAAESVTSKILKNRWTKISVRGASLKGPDLASARALSR